MNPIRRSMVGKLIVLFLFVTLVPVVLVGYLAYQSGKASLEDAEFRTLDAMRQEKERLVRDYVKEALTNAQFLSRDLGVVAAFLHWGAAQAEVGKPLKDLNALDFEAAKKSFAGLGGAQAAEKTFDQFLESNGPDKGYEDFLLVDPATGLVFFTQKNLSDLGTNLKTGPLKESGLGKVWTRIVSNGNPSVGDFSMYEPAKAPCGFLGMPVMEPGTTNLVGVLILRVNQRRLDEIVKVTQAAGKTGDVYLVGQDGFMRSNSRFDKDSTILKKKVHTEPVKLALQEKSGHFKGADYRGQPVFSSYGPVGFKKSADDVAGFEWAIIAQKAVSEALQPAVALGWRIGVMAIGIAGLGAIVAFTLARTTARPMVLLAEKVRLASRGDLTVDIPITGRIDELGTLARAVQVMMKNLRDKVRKVLEGANVVAAASAEISAAVTQVRTGTANTTSAVSESAATAEQVRQSAKTSGDRAKQVADKANKAAGISHSGIEATSDTVGKMNLIKQQMESIGETVVKLSKHSETIENIIATVQDLADQSNLLAVNASIEAARAGEHGKGFPVVAQEIKSLADQSKDATLQIRSILEETGKWVSAVVMATEEGGKAVASGEAQAGVAGEAIRTLAHGVSEWAEAATLVDAASEQQAAGAEQVALAMANIAQAMQQNLNGVAQLQESAEKLEEMAKTVTELLSDYKV